MTQAKGYVDARYLQAAGELLRPVKERSYSLLQATTGRRVLDVGCGPGLDTLALSALVKPGGSVVGIDQDHSMVEQANQRVEQAKLAHYVCHQQGDAATLPLPSAEFDGCRSERLFIHLLNPLQVLAEMIRVTKPGGRIVVVDTDWGTLSIDTDQIGVERQLVRFNAEQSMHNGYAGRQLYRLFKESRLSDVSIEVWPVHVVGDVTLARYLIRLDDVEQGALATGVLTSDELAVWRNGLVQAERNGTFFASVNMILVAGRKP